MRRRLAGGGQFAEHFVPEFEAALAHAVAVDDGAMAVEGYFGGLDGHLELGNEVANGYGHRPGVIVGGAVCLEGFDVFAGEDADGVEVDIVGVLGVDIFEPLQLSDADASSCGKEEEEGGAGLVDQLGGGDGGAVGQGQGEFGDDVAGLVADLGVAQGQAVDQELGGISLRGTGGGAGEG